MEIARHAFELVNCKLLVYLLEAPLMSSCSLKHAGILLTAGSPGKKLVHLLLFMAGYLPLHFNEGLCKHFLNTSYGEILAGDRQ